MVMKKDRISYCKVLNKSIVFIVFETCVTCLDFSKNEIVGDLKKLFMHFLKLCSDFEEKSSFSKKSIMNKAKKRVGRPEILTDKQKKEALDKFRKGHTVYSIAKHYSVTRTVIQRLILKSSDVINSDEK